MLKAVDGRFQECQIIRHQIPVAQVNACHARAIATGERLDGMPLIVDQIGFAGGELLPVAVFYRREQAVDIAAAALELETGEEVRLVGFIVERRQRDKQICRLEPEGLRQRVVALLVGRNLGQGLGQKCLHIRLCPDLVQVGRFPVGRGLARIRNGEKKQGVLRKVSHRFNGYRAAATGFLRVVNCQASGDHGEDDQYGQDSLHVRSNEAGAT